MKRSLFTLALAAGFAFAGGFSLQAEEVDASAVWAKNCRKCHGKEGKGDTKIGEKLKLKDYTNAEVQKSFTDEDIVRVTREGVTADGKETMPAYADKLSEAEIASLVAYIRAMAPAP